MKLMCQGHKSLTMGHTPHTNVSTVKWGMSEVTYGFIAGGAVGVSLDLFSNAAHTDYILVFRCSISFLVIHQLRPQQGHQA